MDKANSGKIKVSVIIPVYNVEKYLKECLDSVINQTLKDIEIICVDDGSSDSSLEILNEYAKKDDRIKILTQKNKGAGKARNKGLEISQGEYLYFMDSDDYLKCDAFEKIYEKITTVNAEICVFKNNIYRQSTKEYGSYNWEMFISNIPNKETFNKYDIPNVLFQFCPSTAWTKMYKASFVKNNRIKFQNLKICNDVYFNCMTLIKADSITFLNETLMTWRTQHACLTATRGNYASCVLEAYQAIKNSLNKKEFELLSETFYKRARSSIIYELTKIKEQNKKDYWTLKLFKFLPKEYWTEQAIELKKQNTLFKKIFSLQNNRAHKVICILGIKFKIKSKKLVLKQKIQEIERQLKKCNEIIAKQECELNSIKEKNLIQEQKLKKLSDSTVKTSQVPDITEISMLKTKYLWDDIKIPEIKNNYETVEVLKQSNKSIIRFGEGEFGLFEGKDAVFQNCNPLLVEKMKEIFKCDDENLLIGVPQPYYDYSCDLNDTSKRFVLKWFPKWHKVIEKYYNYNKTYYSTHISQSYPVYDVYDFENLYNGLKEIWNGKKITIITGNRVYNDIEYNIFENASEINYIYGPTENAFDEYDDLKAAISNIPSDNILIFALGPAGKVLAYDMYKLGYRVLDLGHLIKDYDFYRKSSNMTEEQWNKTRKKFFAKD